ncbi:MAG: CD1871A family CXXC motif-containing protein [Eubacteriales bacterium]|nr:CD1871A family CXXC motif-containing protein [Eubacteriales bacterium]
MRRGGRLAFVRIALLTGAVCMIAYGVSRGEMGTVFTKAVNICLECIGIG